MDKALNFLALARKAGRVELGEEPAGAAARAQKARLIIVASDATDHTWRRAKSFVANSEQICLQVPYTKDELGQAIFSASCGDDKTVEAMLNTDYKEFHIAGHNLAVSQITCMDSERLLKREEEFLAAMR